VTSTDDDCVVFVAHDEYHVLPQTTFYV
jgi:hypothetical protein